jgi:hypothetical protein
LFGEIAEQGGLLKEEAHESLSEIVDREAYQARG